MKQIRIDADALFRAVTATGYKLLAFHLDLNTGEIVSRTLRPDEVSDAPQGPSVAALPKLGGDLTPKKDALPFGPLPVAAPKKDLFGDDGPKKEKFGGDFWKRDSKKVDPFGKDGFRRESATKKLAEMFGDGSGGPRKPDPFASLNDKKDQGNTSRPKPSAHTVAPDDPQRPRIPAFTESQMIELMQLFAKDAGDPQIKAEMHTALTDTKPHVAFERILRKYARTNQQWERYFRKQALLYAETWLSDLGIAWELDEKAESGRGM